MTAAVGLALSVLAALLDLAVPAGPAPRGARRLLRALPAGVLAVTLRLAEAPPLPAAALLAFAVADALSLDGGEADVGAWTTTLLAQLLLVAALWELASPALPLREPWRIAPAAAVLAIGVVLLWRRRPTGPLKALAPLPVLLLAAAAAGASAQGVGVLATFFTAAVGLWSVVAGLEVWRSEPGGLSRRERALRSAAPLALAWPLLPLPR